VVPPRQPRYADPTWVYLNSVGRVPLLSRGEELGGESARGTAQAGDPERALDVERDHLSNGEQRADAPDMRGGRHMQYAVQLINRVNGLSKQGLGEFAFVELQFVKGEFGGSERARYLRVEIAPDYAADSHAHHDPEGKTGNAVEFERSMKRDQDRRGDARNDVKIHPMPGRPVAAKKGNDLAQGVEEDDKEENCAKNAQVDSYGAAGPQQFVLVGVRPLIEGKKIVAGPIDGDRRHQHNGRRRGKRNADAMADLLVPARGFLACSRGGRHRDRALEQRHCQGFSFGSAVTTAAVLSLPASAVPARILTFGSCSASAEKLL